MKSILKLSFITSFIFCVNFAFGQTDMTAEKSSDTDTKEIEEVPQIFKDYSWLKEMVDIENCKGVTVTVLSNSAKSIHKYVVVEQDGKKSMYNSTGKYYCEDHSSINCKEYYKLDTEVDSWKCN